MRCALDRRRRHNQPEEEWTSECYLELRQDTRVLSAPLKGIVHLAAAIHWMRPDIGAYELRDLVSDAVYANEDGTVAFDERVITER
jgi:hypothetical protein